MPVRNLSAIKPYVPYRFKVQKTRRKPIQREYADQCAVIAWARKMTWKYPFLDLLFSIPNGRGVHIGTRMKALREGLVPGMPDLMLPAATSYYNGYFLEMKTNKTDANVRQLAMHIRLRELRYKVDIGYGHQDAIKKLNSYCVTVQKQESPQDA